MPFDQPSGYATITSVQNRRMRVGLTLPNHRARGRPNATLSIAHAVKASGEQRLRLALRTRSARRRCRTQCPLGFDPSTHRIISDRTVGPHAHDKRPDDPAITADFLPDDSQFTAYCSRLVPGVSEEFMTSCFFVSSRMSDAGAASGRCHAEGAVGPREVLEAKAVLRAVTGGHRGGSSATPDSG